MEHLFTEGQTKKGPPLNSIDSQVVVEALILTLIGEGVQSGL